MREKKGKRGRGKREGIGERGRNRVDLIREGEKRREGKREELGKDELRRG